VGATVDLDQRLRKHNKEIKGGAVATGIKVARGHVWSRACHVSGFPTFRAALQFEWRWKQLSRKLSSRSASPLYRRMVALYALVWLPRATSKAEPYTTWETLPEIHLEMPVAADAFAKAGNSRVDTSDETSGSDNEPGESNLMPYKVINHS